MTEYKPPDKVPLQLIDPEFIKGMAWAQSTGEAKHADHHWKDGVSVSDVIGAIKRHISDIESGDYFDDESTLQHAYHAACGLQYIAHYVRNSERYAKFFDQPYGGPPKLGGNVGGQRIPLQDIARHIDQTPRGGS